MRISRSVVLRPALWLGAIVLASATAFAEAPAFESPREALKQGISAYNGGYYELAVPALEAASSSGEIVATYYLARIYSDNAGARTNHAKAYELYQKLANEHADIDPQDDPQAPYVGKALTALAGYMLRGLPEIGLTANPEMAADYLYNASAQFNDDDAQFELAKLKLKGEGVDLDIQNGKHWLATLSKKGHAGAQAFFADLLWRGMHMSPDPVRALALIAIAVSNATPQDRLWIEDIYQNIYCGAGEGIRKQAKGIVAGWGNRYKASPRREFQDRSGLGALDAEPVRTCQNGELVNKIEGDAADNLDRYAGDRAFVRGTTAPGFRDIGVELPPGQAR